MAAEYAAAGWTNALALPADVKFPPPSGFTGAHGRDVEPGDVDRWSAEYGQRFNVALRLPGDVLGLDVDAYGEHGGGDTLTALVTDLGALPSAPRSTSRTDGVSGIRLYRVPEGLTWPTEAGPGIDVVRRGHRYVMAAPSDHPSGGRYRWLTDDGTEVQVPRREDLPELPAEWVEALSSVRPNVAAVGPRRSGVSSSSWLDAHGRGTPCRHVEAALTRHLGRLSSGSGRYDAMVRATLALVDLTVDGCPGTSAALDTYQGAYFAAVEGQHADPGSEFSRAVDGAVASKAGTSPRGYGCSRPSAPAGTAFAAPPPRVLDLDDPTAAEDQPAPTSSTMAAVMRAEELWTSRESLAHVHAFARSRMTSPLATLGAVLARVVAMTPPTVDLPPIIGRRGTLNQFVALVGASGGGKGTAEGAARDAVEFPGSFLPLVERKVGSGEGLVKVFRHRVQGEEVEKTDRALFSVPEVQTFAALGARQGATLLPEVKSAWSGEALGFAYSDESKAVTLAAGSYRATMIVGVQPTQAGALLDDADGGTPQRFVWLPVGDPTIPDAVPAEPMPLRVSLPTGRHTMAVPDVARDAIRSHHVAVARETDGVDPLDGHALYCRLKLAAALALLDRRKDVDEEDWRLAGVLMEVSAVTRGGVVASLRFAGRASNLAQARAEGEREVVKVEALDAAATTRATAAARTVLGKATGDGWTAANVLRRSISGRNRPALDDALAALVATGLVEAEDVQHHGSTGTRYRLSGR